MGEPVTSEKFAVGQSVRRLKDPRLLQGAGALIRRLERDRARSSSMSARRRMAKLAALHQKKPLRPLTAPVQPKRSTAP